MPGVQHLTRTGQFLSRVADLVTLSPRMRRIVLTTPAIAEQSWPLASDIAIVLAGADGREVRRRYTVRASQHDTLTVDAVLHGHGPGSTWAQQLEVGDEVTFFGPRGEIELADKDWLIAITDESGLPAVGALAEALHPRTIRVLAEIPDEQEHYPLAENAETTWLLRKDEPAGEAHLMTAALEDLTRPEGTEGFAYVLGESRVIVAIREELARFGLERNDVYAKGYWNLNSRPTR